MIEIVTTLVFALIGGFLGAAFGRWQERRREGRK